MPNKSSTRPGRSLKERLEVARQMTAEQQRAAREMEPASRRGEQRKNMSTRSERKKTRDVTASSRKSAGPKTRTASREEIEEAKHLRARLSLPSIQLALGTKIAIGVVCALVVALVLLYPVGQRHYQTVREQQRLEAELAAVEARNQEIDEQNKALKTDEGVENSARKDFGWTKEGEAAAVVTNAGDSKTGTSALPDQVDSEQIKPPSTWYYNVLDVVFAYQPDTAAKEAEEGQGKTDGQKSEDKAGQEADKK